MRLLRMLTGAVGLGLLVPASAAALSLPPIDGVPYDSPVHVTSDPGDADRLFVVEQGGRIQLTEGGVKTEFLDISSSVASGDERGLLSMAPHPDYPSNGLFYVFYTGVDDPLTASTNELGDLHIDEFEAGGDAADETSRRTVLTIKHRDFGNHNGGQLQFGADGFLYISTGDGGGGGDPLENAQKKGTLLGKILRIDPEGTDSEPYSDPAGNPFVGKAGRDEIWSYGLRNPWRFSFDRLSGALVIGDVGQGSWEEVDYEPPSAGRGKGDNFGWDCREGRHNYTGPEAPGPDSPSPLCPARVGTFTEPVFEYPNPSDGCAITGGYVVRDPALGDLYGRYVYADLCGDEIRSLCPGVPTASRDRSEGVTVSAPTSFGEDADGRIYVVEHGGTVSRLTGAAAPGECPSPPSSPPGSPPGSPPETPLDGTPPNLELDAKRRQGVGRSLRIRGLVDEAAEVTARAKLRLGGGKALGLGKETSPLAAGVEEKLKWKLSRRERRRARHRLDDGHKVKARVKGKATDASGNVSERESLKIKLAR